MVSYRRNFFLTSEGKVFCVEDVEGETDNHAMEKIRRMLCSDLDHAASFELWRGEVLAYSEGRKNRRTSVPAAGSRFRSASS
jgi:hypothetical protein